MANISNLPAKGTYDWLPEELIIRKYIFDTWRKVCLSFGYLEYLTPLLENAEIYRAKSGEDVGGSELLTLKKDEEELAIRPEMTPSVTRMVSRIYGNTPKPIRLFSIANFYRFQKPQKGRNREFWQLNCDIFGAESIDAEVEIITMAIEILKAFGATSEQFIVYLNDREVIEAVVKKALNVPEDKVKVATRILDKFEKISREELKERLEKEAGALFEDYDNFYGFLSRDEKNMSQFTEKYLKEEKGMQRLKELSNILESLGYGEYIIFNPSMVRGFDYYDGIIFEVFDKRAFLESTGIKTNEGVVRSLFGGGRYNGLASIFGQQSFPAIGFAPGDETTKLFLESYNLIPKNLKGESYFIPLLSATLRQNVNTLALKLRAEGKTVITGLEAMPLGKALSLADKLNANYAVILGEDEVKNGTYLLKDMATGNQESLKI